MCLFVCSFVFFAPSLPIQTSQIWLGSLSVVHFTMMKNVSNETVEEASVMSGAEGARRRPQEKNTAATQRKHA